MKLFAIVVALWGLICMPLLSHSQTLDNVVMVDNAEWVVVLEDPRPARLQGWSRTGYKKSGDYRGALELERFGNKMASRYNMELKDQWLIQSLGVYCLVVKFNGDYHETMSKLKQNKRVQWVQPSNGFELLSQHIQPLESEQYLPLASSQPSLPESVNGEGVVIAVIDSAVDAEHQDLASAINKTNDFVLSDVSPQPLKGEAHGTAIAGVIIAKRDTRLGVAGVAPKAKLEAYRGCWESAKESVSNATQCNTLSLARALDAVSRSTVDILNLSLSGPKDALLDRLIDRVIAQGTIVVAAFDPKRPNSERFPSSKDGVLIVRAQSMDQQYQRVFTAPGSRVVTSPGNRYDYMQGHSVATAYTSGILALYKQAHQTADKPFQLKRDWQRVSTSADANDLVNDLLIKESSQKLPLLNRFQLVHN